jgi:DNA-directed RNA polymerase subunit M/transcription elongation factor TFIIS
MDFCDDCENLLALRLKPENVGAEQLESYCRNCGFTKSAKLMENKCISKNNYDLKEVYIQEKNLEYVCEDPTLPHIDNLDCPNKDCSSYTKEIGNNVVYMKIRENDMKYMYVCCNCKTSWTNN